MVAHKQEKTRLQEVVVCPAAVKKHKKMHFKPVARRRGTAWPWMLVVVIVVLFAYWKYTQQNHNHLQHQEQQQEQSLAGLYGLVKRRAPLEDVGKIEFKLNPSRDKETVSWECENSQVVIHGSTLSSLAMGLAMFYRRVCNIELVSWADSSRPLRPCIDNNVATRQTFTSKFKVRYAWNAVTFSYSTTWWTWERYALELDWLALRGVNLLLAHEGQEYVLQRMFQELCPNAEAVEQFFTHETYFAWNRMGNIHAMGGPPSHQYLKSRHELQLLILRRMRELGIQPVLPGFNGFAPCFGFAEYKLWSGFPANVSSVPKLNPSSPQFALFAKRMVEIQLDMYRTALNFHAGDLLYLSIDPFNENTAEGMEENGRFQELANALISSPKQAAAKAGGVQVKFVMQMWFLANDWQFWTRRIARQFLEAFPPHSLLLLDLHADKRSQVQRLGLASARWFQQDVVFCVLHNFGGGGGLAGEIPLMLERAQESLHFNSGIGFAPEGIEQNELVYDTILHFAWRQDDIEDLPPLNVRDWIHWRYRTLPPTELVSNWQHIYNTAYSRSEDFAGFSNTKTLYEVRPFPHQAIHKLFMPTLIDYAGDTFAKHNLLVQNEMLQSSLAYRYDLVAFTRQALADLLISLMDEMEHDVSVSRDIKQVLDWTGKLLSADERFCFQHAPRAYIALTSQQQRYRKQLLTVWHEDNDGMLADYGSQPLGGSLFNRVYRKRWEEVVDGGEPNYGKLSARFREIEMAWVNLDTTQDECDFTLNVFDVASDAQQFVEQTIAKLRG